MSFARFVPIVSTRPAGRMVFLLCLLLALILAGCADSRGPVETVEQYLQAKVEGDADSLRALLCSDLEAALERETHSFDSVSGVTIEDMVCQEAGSEGVVRCQGAIVALYGTEEKSFPLVSYRTVEEDGEWKWCGEAP